jgi:hypothetical protein
MSSAITETLLKLICIAVLCTILTLGLWPFHPPRNTVAWLGNRDGLRFGRYGTVISSGPFRITSPQNDPGASLEIWLQPNRIWDSGTLLAFYRPENLFQFSLRQSQTGLSVRTGTLGGQHHSRAATFYVQEVFKEVVRGSPRPVFITVTTEVEGARIYIDGVLDAATPQFPLSASEFSGRLVLGDSPGQPDNWSGQLFGLAVYHRELTPKQVFHHYATWTQTGRPEIAEDERNRLLYLFDEHTGDVVQDKITRSGVDLYIPEQYKVMEKTALEPFWTEFRMSQSYWRAVLKNVVGFIPFGFCFYAYLATRLPFNRAALGTVALGTVVSFTIEVLQIFLPTRDSGTTDIITNTLGTWVGVASFDLLSPILVRFFSYVAFEAPPRK